MAIKISNVIVIDDSRNITNANSAVFSSNTFVKLPTGNTAQRPGSPSEGSFRYNTDDNVFEGYDGTSWVSIKEPLPVIETPVNVSPADEEEISVARPTLEATTYRHVYETAKANGIWQISVFSNFSNTVVDATVSGNANTHTITTDLDVSTTYYWRVKYEDADGLQSQFSTATEFNTASSFPPTVLGEPFGGGFYTGAIDIGGGTCYYLIVAPNNSGCTATCWRVNRGDTPGPGSTVDGYTNTYSYLNNATHPAGQFAATRSINGFSDWYLPAVGELAVMNTNKACMPAGEGYVSAYWSSTRDNINTERACTGIPLPASVYKDNTCCVRAIRRIPF